MNYLEQLLENDLDFIRPIIKIPFPDIASEIATFMLGLGTFETDADAIEAICAALERGVVGVTELYDRILLFNEVLGHTAVNIFICLIDLGLPS